jgi:hypothetical protein
MKKKVARISYIFFMAVTNSFLYVRMSSVFLAILVLLMISLDTYGISLFAIERIRIHNY